MTEQIRTDITPEKVRNMAEFELVLDPMDSTMNTLLKVLNYRKEYARAFLQSGNEDILGMIETCNKNIKLILSL